MPGGTRNHSPSFHFVRRTQDEVVYAESRADCAIYAIVGALILGSHVFWWVQNGFLGRTPWLLGSLNGLRSSESRSTLLGSLIVFAAFGFFLLVYALFVPALMRLLVPRELVIRSRDRSVVLRKLPFFWRVTDRIVRYDEVDAVDLTIRGNRARLRLRMKTGHYVRLDMGRLTEEFSRMASEVAGALAP